MHKGCSRLQLEVERMVAHRLHGLHEVAKGCTWFTRRLQGFMKLHKSYIYVVWGCKQLVSPGIITSNECTKVARGCRRRYSLHDVAFAYGLHWRCQCDVQEGCTFYNGFIGLHKGCTCTQVSLGYKKVAHVFLSMTLLSTVFR